MHGELSDFEFQNFKVIIIWYDSQHIYYDDKMDLLDQLTFNVGDVDIL